LRQISGIDALRLAGIASAAGDQGGTHREPTRRSDSMLNGHLPL